jgi:putative ABC transport system permease protein
VSRRNAVRGDASRRDVERPRPVPGERLYRRLLRLCPAAFRGRFGEEMAAFYRERWREARARGRSAAAWAWLRSTVDLLGTALAERAESLGARSRRVDSTTIHDEREGEMLGSIRQDVRYALRGMARSKGFTAVVVATLALGIGANAAIFSVVNGILLRPLPFREPERIVEVSHKEPYYSVSEPEFMDYRRDARAFERLAAYAPSNASLTGAEEPERVRAARVSDGFFATLGVAPALGRVFTADEDAPGGPPVVMISDGVWRRRFGGDRGIVGRTIRVNGTERTVVGVMPARFGYPTATTAVWVPLRLNADSLWTRNNHYLSLVGRLAPGATPVRASAELNTMGRRWLTEYPDIYFPGKPLATSIVPMRDALVGATRPYLLALAGAVGFVLLIACVNVANLLLARGESRRKELAIRTALGASGRRLARQALTESALLGVAGGVLGLLIAWLGGRALLAIAPPSIPRLDEVRIDVAVLAFALAVSLATGLLFGLAPALRAARGDSAETLKQGGKTSGPAGGTRRMRHALVVAEVALAVVMLSGAGLMLRSLAKLQAMDLGFDPSQLLTIQLSLPTQEYSEERAVEHFRELTARVGGLPGVRSVAASGWLPMDGGGGGESSWSIQVDGRVVAAIADAPTATPAQVTPDYFPALRIPIVRGRGFTEADRGDAPLVVVVNQTMARQLWPGQDPIGHTIRMFGDDDPWATVVGVAGDVRSSGFLAPVPPTMHFPYAQAGRSASYTPRSMTLVVRTTGDPLAVAAAVRAAARALDRNVPISSVQSMEQLVAGSIAGRRFSTTLLGAFAALALALAGIGIYGVIAYGVSQRTYELGVRMALGAQRATVLRLVISEGLRMTVLGLAIGLAGALVVGRLVRSLLVDVPAADALTLAVVSAALAGVALVASALPARRASLVSPTEALRNG